MGKIGEPIDCSSCGHTFPQDPPFEVECPHCQAQPNQRCRRPGEYAGGWIEIHKERDLLALKRGFYDHDGNYRCGPKSDSDRAKAIFEKHKFTLE